MTLPPTVRSSSDGRDHARTRVSLITRWLAAGALGAVGLFTGLAARASTTQTVTAPPASTNAPSADPSLSPADPSSGTSLQSPIQNPQPATQTPVAVSGGS